MRGRGDDLDAVAAGEPRSQAEAVAEALMCRRQGQCEGVALGIVGRDAAHALDGRGASEALDDHLGTVAVIDRDVQPHGERVAGHQARVAGLDGHAGGVQVVVGAVGRHGALEQQGSLARPDQQQDDEDQQHGTGGNERGTLAIALELLARREAGQVEARLARQQVDQLLRADQGGRVAHGEQLEDRADAFLELGIAGLEHAGHAYQRERLAQGAHEGGPGGGDGEEDTGEGEHPAEVVRGDHDRGIHGHVEQQGGQRDGQRQRAAAGRLEKAHTADQATQPRGKLRGQNYIFCRYKGRTHARPLVLRRIHSDITSATSSR